MPAVIRREAPARAHRAERRPDDTCGDVGDEVHASRDLRTTRAVEHQVGDEMHLGDVEAARRSVMTHASDFVHALRRLGTGRAFRGRRPSTGTSVEPGAPGRIKPTGRTCHLGAPGNQASRDEAPRAPPASSYAFRSDPNMQIVRLGGRIAPPRDCDTRCAHGLPLGLARGPRPALCMPRSGHSPVETRTGDGDATKRSVAVSRPTISSSSRLPRSPWKARYKVA